MAAKSEQRRLEANYGGGGTATMRRDQDSARERGKWGGMGWRARLEALGCAYSEGGMTNWLGDVGSSRRIRKVTALRLLAGLRLAPGLGGGTKGARRISI